VKYYLSGANKEIFDWTVESYRKLLNSKFDSLSEKAMEIGQSRFNVVLTTTYKSHQIDQLPRTRMFTTEEVKNLEELHNMGLEEAAIQFRGQLETDGYEVVLFSEQSGHVRATVFVPRSKRKKIKN